MYVSDLKTNQQQSASMEKRKPHHKAKRRQNYKKN
jgi:hypothetical protein